MEEVGERRGRETADITRVGLVVRLMGRVRWEGGAEAGDWPRDEPDGVDDSWW